MPGVGTLVNAIAIIAAGATGCLAGNKIPQKMQDTLMKANALAVLFLGVAGVIAKMLTISDGSLSTSGTMMMVISLALGAVVGELLDIEEKFNTFGEWLKVKTGNARDKNFVNAFVTASLTVCIGAMAVIGSIQDGMYGDHSILFAKAVMDFIIVLVMSASMGKGCAFSAIPVAVVQGCMTALARLLQPLMTDAAMTNLSLVGSVLIFAVGVNLLWGKKVRVANLLPALVVAVVMAYIHI
ncbi:MAG: DUF554 domain-containing protein [Eubacteriales bacterium]|jgi:hypothetical protein|nr:DUF554 domain-containing protein [Eubacteriales bacterium]